MEIQITKDAEKMLCEIYAKYLERRGGGLSREAAKDFSDRSKWTDPDWLTDDGDELIRELCHAKMLTMDIVGGVFLTNNAIIYMENRFKNGLSEVLEWLGKIRRAIPFA